MYPNDNRYNDNLPPLDSSSIYPNPMRIPPVGDRASYYDPNLTIPPYDYYMQTMNPAPTMPLN